MLIFSKTLRLILFCSASFLLLVIDNKSVEGQLKSSKRHAMFVTENLQWYSLVFAQLKFSFVQFVL